MFPHPDHIHIDMRSGEAVVRGPFTREEKKVWDEAKAFKEEIDEEIEYLRGVLKDEPERTHLQRMIDQNIGISKRMARLLGE